MFKFWVKRLINAIISLDFVFEMLYLSLVIGWIWQSSFYQLWKVDMKHLLMLCEGKSSVMYLMSSGVLRLSDVRLTKPQLVSWLHSPTDLLFWSRDIWKAFLSSLCVVQDGHLPLPLASDADRCLSHHRKDWPAKPLQPTSISKHFAFQPFLWQSF